MSLQHFSLMPFTQQPSNPSTGHLASFQNVRYLGGNDGVTNALQERTVLLSLANIDTVVTINAWKLFGVHVLSSDVFWKRHKEGLGYRMSFQLLFVLHLLKSLTYRIRNIVRKFSEHPPPILFYACETVADPKTVAEMLAEDFADISRKDNTAPGTHHRQHLKSLGVNFFPPQESYCVPFFCQRFANGVVPVSWPAARSSSSTCLKVLLPFY